MARTLEDSLHFMCALYSRQIVSASKYVSKSHSPDSNRHPEEQKFVAFTVVSSKLLLITSVGFYAPQSTESRNM